ncbi:MAG: MltA domain-containing protein [Caulobacterales bacterium]
MLSACATTGQKPTVQQEPRPPKLALKAASFSDLKGWSQIDAGPALAALQRSCKVAAQRAPEAPFSASAKYGGKVEDWMPACAGAMTTTPADARNFFERNFQPYEVTDEGDGQNKITGYYEPVIQARKSAEAGFEEPIYGRPNDLLQIDLGQFAKAYNSGPDTNLKGTIWGRVDGKKVVPYPARGQRSADSASILAYAHPADVYDLQVQGSARLVFPDGPPMRAGYAAANGWRWNSVYKVLRDRNQIPADQLNKPTVKAWMDQSGPAATREVLNQDPSEVFFTVEAIPDPAVGPKGAQGIPLTPQGSMAIDPSFHPYGAVIFVDGEGPDALGQPGPFKRLAIAQDTGGAIRRGPLRGDFFFGSGDDAGKLAQKMNALAKMWTLLPSANAALQID